LFNQPKTLVEGTTARSQAYLAPARTAWVDDVIMKDVIIAPRAKGVVEETEG
jgi:hypothetical protein